MGHGSFIIPGEFTPLYEACCGEFGPLCDWVAKGWMDDGDVLGWFLHYDGLRPDPDRVVRCYAHIGKDGTVFYHEEPGRGRFKVTHVESRFVAEVPDPLPSGDSERK